VPSALRPLIDEVAQAIRNQDIRGFHASLSRLARAARDTASPAELTAVIGDLLPLIRGASGIVTKLALLAGACVEWGGSPVPLSDVLPRLAVDAMVGCELFPRVWRMVSDGQPLPHGRQNTEVAREFKDYAASHGRDPAPYVGVAAAWFDVLDWINPMITCMGHREFRSALPAEVVTEVREAAAAIATGPGDGRTDDLTGRAHFLEGLAMVLDDEPLIVLDPASRRGFRLTMSGVGDNWQLHTLLADRLSGPDGVPWLEPPRPDWVAEATDAPLVRHSGTDPVLRRFRLYDGTGRYVYPEGRPAGTGAVEGKRVLVLHPPNGRFGWVHARVYEGMRPTLTLDAVLAREEASGWLGRIAPADETDIMSRRAGQGLAAPGG
jgi:hypothetical protein